MSDKQKFLSAQDILASDDLAEEDVFVKEWGGWVTVREISAADRDWLEAEMIKDAQEGRGVVLENKAGGKFGADAFRLRLVTLSLVDKESKQRLFSNKQVEALGRKSNSAITRVSEIVLRINGMSEEEIEAVGEDLERIGGVDSGSVSLEKLDALQESLAEESAIENSPSTSSTPESSPGETN